MTWFPIGPDFVYAPRDLLVARRVSRRNAQARQTMVSALTVDAAGTVYTVDTPYPTGSGAWRRDGTNGSWTSILDALLLADPSVVATTVAVNPVDNQNVFLGTQSGAVYTSATRGDNWQPPQDPGGGAISQIFVDPRGAASQATRVVYAGTQNGLYRSVGGVWDGTPMINGSVTSIAASVPTAGTAHFYVGVERVGVYHSTDPAAGWTLLSTGAAGALPAYASGNFQRVLVDYCRLHPSRVYVWLANRGQSVALWRTDSSSTNWTLVTTALPAPGQGFYSFAFAVTPTSPGTGATDVLLFTSIALFRSADSGQTWQQVADGSHADQHAFGFLPATSGYPVTVVGNDGGLVAYSRLADPAFNVTVFPAPAAYDARDSYDTVSPAPQNLNQGKLAAAVQHYHADPSVPAIGYTSCQDTGLAASSGALGWRGMFSVDGDGRGVACTPAANGVVVWLTLGSPFFLNLITDDGSIHPPMINTLLDGAAGAYLVSTSNHVLDPNKRCVVGAQSNAQLKAPTASSGVVTFTPSSMAHIRPGISILIDNQLIQVAASPPPTATTFSAAVTQGFAQNDFLRIYNSFVARVDQSGTATQISQELGNPLIFAVAGSPSDADQLACITDDATGHRVWVSPAGPLGPASVWTEPTTGRPVGNGASGLQLSSVAIDGAGNLYALLTSLDATVGGLSVTTPLFQISAGSWTPMPPANALPTGVFGAMVADPVQPNTLYVASGNRVYRVQKIGSAWQWTDVGPGLPGPPIVDLWIGNIAGTSTPKVLLRACVASRGVYEHDVTLAAVDPPARPYLRNHFLDLGWLSPVPDGLVNPFSPAGGGTVFHYQSADVKVDARQAATVNTTAFFQTDPEGTTPLSHVAFNQLVDNSSNLPDSDLANVHVQVHNRSNTGIDGLNVWAIYAPAAGGVPSLKKSASHGDNFDFWSQFHPDGAIVPSLPPDSPWNSLKPAPDTVQSVSGLDASHPQVASWMGWQVPALTTGDHFCVAVFVHGPGHLIAETSGDVDAITRTNPQVAQKNLHVGPPL
jgi:hypothetical protein